jgi:hypothetical protein
MRLPELAERRVCGDVSVLLIFDQDRRDGVDQRIQKMPRPSISFGTPAA